MVIFDLLALVLLFAFLGTLGWGSWTLVSVGRRSIGGRRERKQLARRQAAEDKTRGESWEKLIAEGGGYGPEQAVEGYRVFVPLKTALSAEGKVRFSVDCYEWGKNGWFMLRTPADETRVYPAATPFDQLSEQWAEFCINVAERLNRPTYELYAQSKLDAANQAEQLKQAGTAVEALPPAHSVTEGLASSEIPRV